MAKRTAPNHQLQVAGISRRADPLTEDQASDLLTLVDVVRDPLHGDIRLTALERHILDSPEFQRLRNINQLAMTYMAYPGALHTRFLHSLGVLHVTATMLATCQSNADTYSRLADPAHPIPLRITSYPLLLARLCGLMHDMAHVPFGHTFEKEAKLFPNDEWKDEWRRDQIFASNATFRTALVDFLTSRRISAEAANALLDEIREVLIAPRKAIELLPYPFVHDIVGNTICADLIDYVQRDMYFCGLTETLGKRFLEYLAVIPVKSEGADDQGSRLRPIRPLDRQQAVFRSLTNPQRSCRLVLLQYRYNERRTFVQKHDVVAEAIDLVRRRLTVAEKLYFHRTKIVASAMLSAAVSASSLTVQELWVMSDHEVLKELERSTNPTSAILGSKLRNRRLFKPVYRAAYHTEDETHASSALWADESGAYARFSNPTTRRDIVTRLERLIGIEGFGDEAEGQGTVVISCPDRDMNLKAFDMLVLQQPGAVIKRLQDSTYAPTQKEIQAIQDTHRHLWQLEVFVDPDAVDLDPTKDFTKKLVGAIQYEVRLSNEHPSFGHITEVDLADLETEIVVSHELAVLGVAAQIRHQDRQELLAQRLRGTTELELRDRVRRFLIERGYRLAEE